MAEISKPSKDGESKRVNITVDFPGRTSDPDYAAERTLVGTIISNSITATRASISDFQFVFEGATQYPIGEIKEKIQKVCPPSATISITYENL